ncbi:DUF3131 domain-containing protein [uncultured Shewanella sp.]|uniref:DUF3131 domain-containing protein n=1 Tax=uncultured Shewanella sp. TaxID=173975 RepID=UPI00261A772B|nr:DUF3131 domain-containing protein [uncultured Shewanella sp.]
MGGVILAVIILFTILLTISSAIAKEAKDNPPTALLNEIPNFSRSVRPVYPSLAHEPLPYLPHPLVIMEKLEAPFRLLWEMPEYSVELTEGMVTTESISDISSSIASKPSMSSIRNPAILTAERTSEAFNTGTAKTVSPQGVLKKGAFAEASNTDTNIAKTAPPQFFPKKGAFAEASNTDTDIAKTDSPPVVSKKAEGAEASSEPQTLHFQRRAVIPTQDHSAQTKTSKVASSELKKSPGSAITLPLTRQEKLLLSKAQRFMDDNWNATTGFIDSVNGYTQTTMWDLGSAISGILALDALGVTDKGLTQIRLEKLLATLMSMPLYDDKLPNRQYNTVTGKPSGPYSQSRYQGNGWSALDLGRLYIWLEVIKQQKPILSSKVDAITDKWQLDYAVKNQTLFGVKLTSKGEHFRQEGRLGYLQYAAKGYQLAGLNVDRAYDCDNLGEVEVEGVTLLLDKRNLPFFTLDPYLLYAIEVGLSSDCWFQLNRLYQLHKQHYQNVNLLKVYAEDSLNRRPWFLYNNIFYQGYAWWSVSSSGKNVPKEDTQRFSNKAAFAMSMLFDDDYARLLAEQVVKHSLKHRHVPTGIFSDGKENVAYNINTNALILVSLWFKSRNYTPILM